MAHARLRFNGDDDVFACALGKARLKRHMDPVFVDVLLILGWADDYPLGAQGREDRFQWRRSFVKGQRNPASVHVVVLAFKPTHHRQGHYPDRCRGGADSVHSSTSGQPNRRHKPESRRRCQTLHVGADAEDRARRRGTRPQ